MKQPVIQDAGRGEPASAGQHIYCRNCGKPIYGVAGCALVKCDACHTWNQVGRVLVRPAERRGLRLVQGGRQ